MSGQRTRFRAPSLSGPLLIGALFLRLIGAADVVHISNSRLPNRIPFEAWLNQTQRVAEHCGAPEQECGPRSMFVNHSSYTEGEVLLFKTKRSRYRAIPVMGPMGSAQSSKFNDALTFKQWLKRVYSEQKAVKVTVRTTDVVRPVMLHLHASRDRFRAPIIIHADVFDSKNSAEKAVDAAVFIDGARKLLPEAIISLGWTKSADFNTVNRLDWRQAFRLVEPIYNLKQPLILNMKLNDAVHSASQLEWLLGAERPTVYLVVKGEATDLVERWTPLEALTTLAAGRKLLFDVDDTWRTRLSHVVGEGGARKKEKRDVDLDQWTNLAYPSPFSMLSTSVLSTNGIAFLGWPNSLAISNKRTPQWRTPQRISGKVLFLAKRQAREISSSKRSGLVIDLFETEPDRLIGPEIVKSIRVFIGYDGRISIENRDGKGRRSLKATRELDRYHESAASRMPKRPCYGFDVLDRGWRVELEVRSLKCLDDLDSDDINLTNPNALSEEYRTFIQLETPAPKQRRPRFVALAKTGDGAIDFLVRELRHSAAAKSGPVLAALFFLLIRLLNTLL